MMNCLHEVLETFVCQTNKEMNHTYEVALSRPIVRVIYVCYTRFILSNLADELSFK